MPPLASTGCADAHCEGLHYTIHDEPQLARLVALVLVREYSLARGLLRGAAPHGPATITSQEAETIVAKRLHLNDPYHRDGYLFQLITWVPAEAAAPDNDFVVPPQVRAADKGQDGVILHLEPAGVAGVTVCEDKATESPRETIRKEVFPELAKYERGERDDELLTHVIAGLGTSRGIVEADAIAIAKRIVWSDARRYRVRITVEGARTETLFKDFQDTVPGASARRRGETFEFADLRAWMDVFALSVEAQVRALVGVPNV